MKLGFEAGRLGPANIGRLGWAALHQTRMMLDSRYYAEVMIDEREERQNDWDNFFDKFPLVIEGKALDHRTRLSFMARTLGHQACRSLQEHSLAAYGQILALRQVVESLPPEALDSVLLSLDSLKPLKPYFEIPEQATD